MTDPHDHRLDELASAHLDGMTTPEEEQQIASDPELQRRVARLGSVRAALAEGPPVDDDRREAAITAALDALDDDRPAAITRRIDRRPAALPVLAAAAIVVLIAAVATLLLRDTDDGDLSADDASSADLQEETESGGGADEQAATSDAPVDAAAITDLGDFADLGALEGALRADGSAGPTTTSVSSEAADSDAGEVDRFQTALRSCTGANAAADDLARATVAGSPVLVVRRPAEATGAVALVLDPTSCAVLLEVAG